MMMRRGGLTLFARTGLRISSPLLNSSAPSLLLTTSRLSSSAPSGAAASSVPTRKVKASTGIAGLDVVPNAREVLIGLYNKYLAELQVFEPTSPYRKLAENMTRERLRIVEENEDIAKIEGLIDNGQVEELIQEAMSDIELVPWWLEHKPWEDSPHKRVPVFEREF